MSEIEGTSGAGVDTATLAQWENGIYEREPAGVEIFATAPVSVVAGITTASTHVYIDVDGHTAHLTAPQAAELAAVLLEAVERVRRKPDAPDQADV